MNPNKVSTSCSPYIRTIANLPTATTLQDVRLELARKETLQLAAGYVPQHKVSMMGFFSMGFDIEDQQ